MLISNWITAGRQSLKHTTMFIDPKALLKAFLMIGFIIIPILVTIKKILTIYFEFDFPDFAIGMISGYMFRVFEKRFQDLS